MDAVHTHWLDHHRVGKLRGAVAVRNMGRNYKVASDEPKQSLV